MSAFFNQALLHRLGAMMRGETTEPETEEAREMRLHRKSKAELVAKSQRGVILEDLEHSVHALQLFLESKDQISHGKYRRLSRSRSSEGSQGTDKNEVVHAEDRDERMARANSCGGGLMMESTDEQKQLLLTDEIAVVNMVCTALYRCAAHGLRAVESNEEDTVKFFGVVKWTCTRVGAIRQKHLLDAMQHAGNGKKVCELVTSSMQPDLPRQVRGFLAAARAAGGLTNVITDEGKARAFLRQALNMHVLAASMSLILSETNLDLLASYYSDLALFRQRDDVKMFTHLIAGLDDLSFAFLIDDSRLDQLPDELPFSKPPPRLKAQKIRKKAPKLIDPEDMVGGRVRLCEEDEDTNLLADKLVAHHHLRSAFNSLKGGNPLSDILKKAAQTKRLEDAGVAVLRFLELGYPEYDVYGTPLLDVLCNPFLSGMARFETSLGIPDVAEACICYLYEHLDTPGLLQVHLQADHVMELRDTVEEMGGFHKRMTVDPHEVTAILFQYLWELPDALLTEERLDNFLACGGGAGSSHNEDGMDREEKKILLKVLVNDLPWYCKPLVERLCDLVMTALEPSHSSKNGLTLYSVANSFAPLLLRRAHIERFHEYEDATYRKYPVGFKHSSSARYRLLSSTSDDLFPYANDAERARGESRALRHATRDAQEGARVLTLLFEEHVFILSDFRKEVAQRRAHLQAKVQFMETIRFRMEEPIDVPGNARHVALLKRLWDLLIPSPEEQEGGGESMITVQDHSTGKQVVDTKALLASKRWKMSGFHTENPLGGFRGGGVLSLECLIYLLEQYPEKARAMMTRNAVAGGNRYPFPVASINVMRMMMKLLMLDEAPNVSSKLVLHSADPTAPPSSVVLKMRVAERVSRTPFWHVFDDNEAFFKLQAMAFMLLDLHWLHSGATQMGFQPVLDATRRQVGWLLEQAPQSVEDMWKTWMEVREQHATKYAPMYPATTLAAETTAAAVISASNESDALVATLQRKQEASMDQEERAPNKGMGMASTTMQEHRVPERNQEEESSKQLPVDTSISDDSPSSTPVAALAY